MKLPPLLEFSALFLLICASSMTMSHILMKTNFFEYVFIALETHLAIYSYFCYFR